MLNTNSADISQARFDAVAATERHLRRNGASLCDLLDALDDPEGRIGPDPSDFEG